MELIDKAALVAEIEKRIKETESMQPMFDQFWAGQISAFNGILKILNTLEVKRVDLEKKEEKLNKAIKLADAMYDAAQQLTTDASRLHKAMQDWWNFKNIEL
jgi:hypothetical protein